MASRDQCEPWPLLGDKDRFVRHAARLVLERIDPKKYADKIWKEPNDLIAWNGIIALCHTNQAMLFAPGAGDSVSRSRATSSTARRAKGGIDNVHPLSGREIRALRQLRREDTESRYVFVTERGGPATTAGFLKTIARTGEAAKIPFPIHPHMLRHSTGYKLANDGHDTRALQHYMGHKNIMHTVRYTEMAPDRFKNFWKD